ncbi:hypothetical protein PAXRUDRAFT_177464 [Paxillus rubicundulus Ve08.2h10]|uniref:Uncharacterized protein n=1 Tax=Paxillus rubicundulus Ve08.2h10 TaxID=930991 RepID=A0A0D0BQI4_9AGAM|nr:hypothetical protein PAXRUDRAFT_177464 [Paxillus rubicundulus Ve08.2h10]
MNIMELLNPVDETHNMVGATDEDIFESMMDARKLREMNRGNGDDIDVSTWDPTRHKALQAAITLRKYVSTFDDLFACKLEVMLGSFGQWSQAVEMQAMNNTKLTDYFTCK